MNQPPRILVSLVTYNEMDNLPHLVEEIFQVVPEVDILVVDDNSPDGTGRWCAEQQAVEPRLNCLHRPGKMGLGSATLAAFRYAAQHEYDFVVNLDADRSHSPQHLPELLAAVHADAQQPVDVAIGSRYVAGGKIDGWSWRRRCASRMVNWLSRVLLGLRVRDCTGSYRCYRATLFRQLDFAAVRSAGYAFEEEILWHLKRLGARFTEIPICFVERQHGQSKVTAREAALALREILGLGLRHWLGRGSRV